MEKKDSPVVRGVDTEETRASMVVHIQEAEAAAFQGQDQRMFSGKALSLKEENAKKRTEKKKQAKKILLFLFLLHFYFFSVHVYV